MHRSFLIKVDRTISLATTIQQFFYEFTGA